MTHSTRYPRRAGAVAALVLACAAVAAPPAPAAGDSADDGDYVTFTAAGARGTEAADMALVYVVRPTSIGFAIKSFFFVDETIAGINRGSSYFFVLAKPGERVFWSKSENVDALRLTVEAGRTYYIQQHVRMGGFRARTKLEVLEEAAGVEALEKCDKYGTMTARGLAKGEELAREHRKDVEEDLARRAAEEAQEKSGKRDGGSDLDR
jgi:hypothetical protein